MSPSLDAQKGGLLDNADMSEDCKSDGGGNMRYLAQAHMSFVMPLSPYNDRSSGEVGSGRARSPMSASNFDIDQLNIDNLKSNNNKEAGFLDMQDKMSDGPGSP